MAPPEGSSPSTPLPWGLRRLTSGTGAATLIFMPDVGGNVLWATPLVASLAAVADSYSLLLPQDFLTSAEEQTIKHICAQFADRIIGARLPGPLHLIGHSYAGFLAYETGAQLSMRGVAPDMVWLLDLATFRPPTLVDIARHPVIHANQLVQYLRSHRHNMKQSKSKADILSAYGRVILDLSIHPEAYREIIRKAYSSIFRYQPEESKVPVTVLCAVDQDGARIKDGLGWRDVARGPFRSIDVPGDHLTMLRRPENAQFVAEIIRNALPYETVAKVAHTPMQNTTAGVHSR